MVGEFKCHKHPSTEKLGQKSDNVHHYRFDRISDLLLIPTGFLHIPEHIYIMVYLYKFIGAYLSWEEIYRRALWSQMCEFVCTKKSILYGIALVLLIVVALLLPISCIHRTTIQQNVTEEYCSQTLGRVQHSLAHLFHSVSFLTYGVVVLTRCLMVLFTVMVGVMWRRIKPTNKDLDEVKSGSCQRCLDNATTRTLNRTLSEDWVAICCRHSECLTEYVAIKQKVIPIYKIFRSFFVLQWIIHLFGLLSHAGHLMSCLLYTSPSPRDATLSRMPSSA